MPRISRRTPRQKARLTLQQVTQLLVGDIVFSHERLKGEALAAAWEEWGEALTALHISYFPQSRPWGWWEYDAPEPRKCLNMAHPHSERRYPAYAKALHFGVPRYYFVSPVGSKEMPWDNAVFETQEGYLRRHRLLMPAERHTGARWRDEWPVDKLIPDPYLSREAITQWYREQT
jgi:hypothetical protein